ncbi:MAG: glutamate 5-kinase [Actinomycetota bacterium]
MTGASDSRVVVVKVGTSSITRNGSAELDREAIVKLCMDIADMRAVGHRVVLVSSAAIAAGMHKLGIRERPRDFESLQALSAVGQIELMRVYDDVCRSLGFSCGQVLLAPPDFFDRARYLRARSCIEQQLAYGVLPIINENDAVADDAIRFGDNDRIAALVAHLIRADLLVLLTDTPGVLTADPRVDREASLIEEILQVDREIESLAGGAATTMSQGGMASKLSAAKIASWSGVDVIIAAAHRPDVLADAVAGAVGVGTMVRARSHRLSARKLWIAFALGSAGTITVDAGARQALLDKGGSLLAVGVTAIDGGFAAGDAVEVAGPDGEVFAKGLVPYAAAEAGDLVGARSIELIHRDDFVLLPDAVPSPG